MAKLAATAVCLESAIRKALNRTPGIAEITGHDLPGNIPAPRFPGKTCLTHFPDETYLNRMVDEFIKHFGQATQRSYDLNQTNLEPRSFLGINMNNPEIAFFITSRFNRIRQTILEVFARGMITKELAKNGIMPIFNNLAEDQQSCCSYDGVEASHKAFQELVIKFSSYNVLRLLRGPEAEPPFYCAICFEPLLVTPSYSGPLVVPLEFPPLLLATGEINEGSLVLPFACYERGFQVLEYAKHAVHLKCSQGLSSCPICRCEAKS